MRTEEYQKAADAAMLALDSAVGAFAAKEMSRDEFESAVKAVVSGFNGMSSSGKIKAYMDVEFSGAYSDSESIYVYYEVSDLENDSEEIIATPSRVRLSRHAQRN